jgi:hypothetical protein
MDRLAQDIVGAGGEQTQCIVERVALVEAKNRRVRPLANLESASRSLQSPMRKASTALMSMSLILPIHSRNSEDSMPADETPSRSKPVA